jgi:hypothetical protein
VIEKTRRPQPLPLRFEKSTQLVADATFYKRWERRRLDRLREAERRL